MTARAISLQAARLPRVRAKYRGCTVRIWSGEHCAYWRPNCAGYCADPAGAGVYLFEDAYANTAHCDPSKQIAFEFTPTGSVGVNPWRPMARAIDLKHLGKLGEELGEAAAATARCIIQGIDEREPVTGKPNREWLEDELADVIANATLVTLHFKLDRGRILARARRKVAQLRAWHAMLDEGEA